MKGGALSVGLMRAEEINVRPKARSIVILLKRAHFLLQLSRFNKL